MHRTLLFLLAFFARMIIARHRPFVIGITGTVGKTTLSHHIAEYLKQTYGGDNVWVSPYHYNGEYGLPLTILRAKTGGKNPFAWMMVFLQVIITYIRPYPRYIVLEYGIDHIGEMEYLLSIVPPDIALLLPVSPNHIEQFGTFDAYYKAKLMIISAARLYAIAHESHRSKIDKENVYYYGQDKKNFASIASAIQNLGALSVDIVVDGGGMYHIDLPLFGVYQGENILPVYIVAFLLETDLDIISQNPNIFLPAAGRSRMMRGIAGSTIIDGSYNGGFESMSRGLEDLVGFAREMPVYCVLGDMRELGALSESLHTELAMKIRNLFSSEIHNITFFLVGTEMSRYVAPILEGYFTVLQSLSSRNMGNIISIRIHAETTPPLIYVKGSQNTIFLEEVVSCLLTHPDDRRFLCRQSHEWMSKKNIFFSTISQEKII